MGIATQARPRLIYFVTNSLKMYAGQRVRIRLLMLVILNNDKNIVLNASCIVMIC
jgi:hypothetical protein